MKKLNPYLVRGYVLLAAAFCQLAWWIYKLASLITNYLKIGWGKNAELREPLSIAKWEVGLHSA